MCSMWHEQLERKMWERFTLKQAWARSVVAEVEKERQNGTGGDWQQETPNKEELELVRHSGDLRFERVLMRRAYGEVRRLEELSGRVLER